MAEMAVSPGIPQSEMQLSFRELTRAELPSLMPNGCRACWIAEGFPDFGLYFHEIL
jgi:hypothetical protein